jgi:hypothetical protein
MICNWLKMVKKIVEPKPKKVVFVAETELRGHGWTTFYSTEVDGNCVKGSMSLNKKEAEKFYEIYLKNNCKNSNKVVVREEYV